MNLFFAGGVGNLRDPMVGNIMTLDTVERRGLGSGRAREGVKAEEIGVSLTTLQKVEKLQSALHAKAKGSPNFRIYSLYDKK
jgi:hypothetical protein